MKVLFLLNTLFFSYIAFWFVLLQPSLGNLLSEHDYSLGNFYLPILLITIGVGYYTFRVIVRANSVKPTVITKSIFLCFFIGCMLAVVNYPRFDGLKHASIFMWMSIAIAILGTAIEGGFILLSKNDKMEF